MGYRRKARKVMGPGLNQAFLTAFVSAALDYYYDSILAKQRYYSSIVTRLGPRAVPFQNIVRVFEQYVEGVMAANQEKGKYDKEHYPQSLAYGITSACSMCIYSFTCPHITIFLSVTMHQGYITSEYNSFSS